MGDLDHPMMPEILDCFLFVDAYLVTYSKVSGCFLGLTCSLL